MPGYTGTTCVISKCVLDITEKKMNRFINLGIYSVNNTTYNKARMEMIRSFYILSMLLYIFKIFFRNVSLIYR